jgi:PPK2 family polyphosphate:nucleotide phosphotransferase
LRWLAEGELWPAPFRSGGEAEYLVDEGPLRRHVVGGHGTHLSLGEHRHGLHPGQRPPSGPKALEAKHRPRSVYAQDRWAVLLIFQAMDAAGKDSTIKHVMSGVNPQGVDVHAFKQPSAEDLDHDFLWRTARRLPERGRIGVFNRSYYEEVLVVRAHEATLRAQKLPPELVGERIWRERHEDIAALERYLARNGTLVLKFSLNVSREEQKRRFLARLEGPEKHWKFSPADVAERAHWGAYLAAYEDTIRATAAPHAPWFVVPADRKWFARICAGAVLAHTLIELDPQYPVVSQEAVRDLAEARRELEAQAPEGAEPDPFAAAHDGHGNGHRHDGKGHDGKGHDGKGKAGRSKNAAEARARA